MDKKIRNRVIETFSSVHYSCQNSDKRELSFFNFDGSVEIKFDVRQYPQIHQFLNPSKQIKELRIYFNIKYGKDIVTVSPSQFKALDLDIDCLLSNCKSELEENILRATEILVTSVIPLLDTISLSMICMETRYYELLSVDTQKKATEFAARYNRDLLYTSENKNWATNWLRQMRMRTSNENPASFDDSLDEVIAFAAYIGQIILSGRDEGYWTWVHIPDDENQKYCIFFPSKEDGYDLLQVIIQFWNFNLYFHEINLFPTKHR